MYTRLLLTGLALGSFAAALASEIETIVVSASRLTTTDQQATLLSRNDINWRQAHYSPDALKSLPGLALSQSGNRGGLTQGRLRGGEANHLMVLLDGIDLNDPALGSAFNFAHLNLIGTTQFELLGGPQSSVWGSDAISGLMYIDTTPTESITRFDAAYGTHATTNLTAEFARVDTSSHVAASVNYLDTDGTNVSLDGDEDDGFRNIVVHLNGGIVAGGWDLRSVVRFLDGRTEFDPTPPPNFVPADGDRVTDVNQGVGKIEASYLDFDTWTPMILLAKTHMHSENSADGVETDSTTGDRTTMTFSNNFDLAPHHSLNATAEHEVQKFKQRGAPPQDQKIKTTSAAGEYQYGIEKFLLSVSGRYDDNDAFDNSFVYRAGALYRFETWRLFGSYGTASKNPTFSERFGFAPEFFLGNPDLEPEQSRGYEIGAGATWRAVDVSITGFSSRLTNEINGFVFDADSGFFTAENVDGTSRRKGGELAVRANLNSLSVDASYSYVDATEDGTAEIRRPKHLGRIQVTGLIVPTLRFNVGVTYTGKQIDIDFGTFTRVTLSDYRLLSAGLAWRPRHNVTLHLQGENLANVKYQDIFGYANPSRTIMVGVGIEL